MENIVNRKYQIYQITDKQILRKKGFLDFRQLELFAKCEYPDINDYELVYESSQRHPTNNNNLLILEELYADFNGGMHGVRPADYKGRSISVSDIISITDEKNENLVHFYYVDSFGFVPLTRFDYHKY
jgi:hypothetical protein